MSNLSDSKSPASGSPPVQQTPTLPRPLVLQLKPPTPHDLIPFEFLRKDRTLVVCFDGTGDEFDKANSNVVEFLSMLKKDDWSRQMVYYRSGFETYTGRDNTTSSLKAAISKTWDSAVAWDLKKHVKEGYTFLMQNYIDGDRISLFGFSRGAYAARALAGMIHKVGLLPPGNVQQVPFAYNVFTRTDNDSWNMANLFKKSFSIDVTIDFIGLWDSVRSVGLLDKSLPFSTSNNNIKYFRHAIALDEHRSKFKANPWNPPSAEDLRKGQSYDKPSTNVKEVWFAGVHCDVGGGSMPNGAKHSLAKIPLRWMVKECFRCKTGILFKAEETFAVTGLTPDLLQSPALDTHISKDISSYSTFSSTSAISESESRIYDSEVKDAVQPLNDQLVQNKAWWILEILPLHTSLPGVTETMKKRLSFLEKVKLYVREHPFNNGKGRMIPLKDTRGVDVNVSVHHSVFERIQKVSIPTRKPWAPWVVTKQPYTPKAINWSQVQHKIIWTD